ncbi:hypothetical protein NNC19_18825 [Clostridium sp. SHJSY1]|uniref:hypothetical protein n=1 Tax=Clostridium sp. SHJSY1 TaxID=2942483 RepID=UPI0028757B64|nr:hypothetical protein [Clostridium sp. SHJSY1]MDS0527748.1 hypothetical protein [Clostridium sp. SHJSY1]
MRYYIVGPVSSGKSTLAKRLSEVLDISYKSLDEVVYVRDKSASWGNHKREVEERDKILWRIEDGYSFNI